MHVVNPHQVSGTRRRCQAIAVLISLQLCLISSVEANHVAVGELGSSDTDTVEPTWRSVFTSTSSHVHPRTATSSSSTQHLEHLGSSSSICQINTLLGCSSVSPETLFLNNPNIGANLKMFRNTKFIYRKVNCF